MYRSYTSDRAIRLAMRLADLGSTAMHREATGGREPATK